MANSMWYDAQLRKCKWKWDNNTLIRMAKIQTLTITNVDECGSTGTLIYY